MNSLAKPNNEPIHVERILRRAGRHHFAFLKAYLEGLDIRPIAVRYLEDCNSDSISIVEIRKTLSWIRNDLSTLAKRNGKLSYARSINIEPHLLRNEAPIQAVPTLEEFREEHDPYEMYSENELIELFQEKFPSSPGSNRKFQRNQRLLKKQTEALNFLQSLIPNTPKTTDPIEAWLTSTICSRLHKQNIETIEDLISYINDNNYLWHKKIKTLGSTNASRILKWLIYYEDEFEIKIEKQSRTKQSELNSVEVFSTQKKRCDIVPLELFKTPESLDGSNGSNCGDRSVTGVTNDYDAIMLWLRQKDNKNTYRAARKEAERLLLWSILEKGKALSSLTVQDCSEYLEFLNDLGRLHNDSWSKKYKIPFESWVGHRGTVRFTKSWKPFEKPAEAISKKLNLVLKRKDGVLTKASQRQAYIILNSMFKYFNDTQYCYFNPFKAMKKPSKGLTSINADRSFTIHQWGLIINFLNNMKKDSHYFRIRFLLKFGYATGMRVSEIVAAKIGDLVQFNSTKTGRKAYLIKVLGKGNVEREIVLSKDTIQELNEYLASRQIHDIDQCEPHIPLVGSIGPTKENKYYKTRRDPNKSLSINRAHEILKAFFDSVAASIFNQSKSDALNIAKASAHWLRHTCGSHMGANKIDVQVIQLLFGHSSIQTTSVYVKTERERLLEAVEHHSNNPLE